MIVLFGISLFACRDGGSSVDDTDVVTADTGDVVENTAPIFDQLGEERLLNASIFVVEGDELDLTLSAFDAEGDALEFSANKLPPWAILDATGEVSGTAPMWDDDFDVRNSQIGIFDVEFTVSDGVESDSKIVSIHVLDARWDELTMAELVAQRPISDGGDIGTPVELRNVEDEVFDSSYGGELRRITFGFTSQVPDVDGWEEDWASELNVLYLPVDGVVVENVGAIVEGAYAQDFGEIELAERTAAELKIPVLIINRGWDQTWPGNLMQRYEEMAVETREPRFMFYVFTSAHYLRATDAMISVLDEVADADVAYEDFQVMLTGHSKMGHSCYTAAAADPERVLGIMASGCSSIDTSATRLLGDLQGARSTKPGAFPHYRGMLVRTFAEPLALMDEMNPNLRVLLAEGTDDDKARDDGYTPKYSITVADREHVVPHSIGYIPNAPHTTQTPLHSAYWRMWVGHTLLGDEVSEVQEISHSVQSGGVDVEAAVSPGPGVATVRFWATSQSDRDTSSWDEFSFYDGVLEDGVYRASIPEESTAYFVEILDVNGGMVTSSPQPVDEEYPLL
ncbi:MAG: hypothetical protein HN348_06430 [Proteobacteria bacterium]|nr:hypothetical protein [Pseudomonadota bacterium]